MMGAGAGAVRVGMGDGTGSDDAVGAKKSTGWLKKSPLL